MADTIFGSGNDQWVCPNDRQLALRAKLQTGWSVHTYQTEKQRRSQSLSPAEVEAILQVIQRAERLDVMEQQRIGRLVERLETMRRNVMGNGLSQCLLCGEVLGFLGSSSVFCKDCRKKVCTKCGIETSPGQKRPLWLCYMVGRRQEPLWRSRRDHPGVSRGEGCRGTTSLAYHLHTEMAAGPGSALMESTVSVACGICAGGGGATAPPLSPRDLDVEGRGSGGAFLTAPRSGWSSNSRTTQVASGEGHGEAERG
ncbi:Hypothetical predicted protein [Marmota monax]|uniref:RabBD domain-containing protein n=1 Tax=Marmota monax TaxID=9995 RepID=A0A5E4ACU4_MARMO|nr:Hypothetical predicted protein [Marmota monax]